MESKIEMGCNELPAVDFVQTYRFLVGKVYDLDNEFLSKLQMVRKILSCSVCDEVVRQPYSVPGCDHLSCERCIGCRKERKRVERCVNKSCQDWTKHQVDELALCYVGMFKDLCKFICTTRAMRVYMKRVVSSSLWSIVKEGALIDIEPNTGGVIEETVLQSIIEESADPVGSLRGSGDTRSCIVTEKRIEKVGSACIVPSLTSGCSLDENLTEERLSNGVEVELLIKLEHQTVEPEPSALPKCISPSSDEVGRKKEARKFFMNSGTESSATWSTAKSDYSKRLNGKREFDELVLSVATNSPQTSASLTSRNTVIEEEAASLVSLSYRRRPSKVKNSCRCGVTAAVPGTQTCSSQRCPCYVKSEGCRTCKCKGCRNPYVQGGKHNPRGLQPVVGAESTSTVQLHAPPISQPVIPTGGEIIYGGIMAAPTCAQLYPVGTAPVFGSFSLPLPILSLSQHANQHEPDRLPPGGGIGSTQTYAVNFL